MSVAVVAWPLFKGYKERRDENSSQGVQAERLRTARLRIYRRIVDLEEDRKGGALSEEDWRTQLKILKVAAARILQAEDAIAQSTAERTELEREVLKARKGKGSSAGDNGDDLNKAESIPTSDKELVSGER